MSYTRLMEYFKSGAENFKEQVIKHSDVIAGNLIVATLYGTASTAINFALGRTFFGSIISGAITAAAIPIGAPLTSEMVYYKYPKAREDWPRTPVPPIYAYPSFVAGKFISANGLFAAAKYFSDFDVSYSQFNLLLLLLDASLFLPLLMYLDYTRDTNMMTGERCSSYIRGPKL